MASNKRLSSLAEFYPYLRNVWDSTRKKIAYWWLWSARAMYNFFDWGLVVICPRSFKTQRQPISETTRILVELRHQCGTFWVQSPTSLEDRKYWACEGRPLYSGYRQRCCWFHKFFRCCTLSFLRVLSFFLSYTKWWDQSVVNSLPHPTLNGRYNLIIEQHICVEGYDRQGEIVLTWLVNGNIWEPGRIRTSEPRSSVIQSPWCIHCWPIRTFRDSNFTT